MTAFDLRLAQGRAGENARGAALVASGHTVWFVRHPEGRGYGPSVVLPESVAVAPDLLVTTPERSRTYWLEVKTYSQWGYMRAARSWRTGIKRRHLDDYLKVDAAIPCWPVFLLFQQSGELAGDYGGWVRNLQHGIVEERHGTVYWAHPSQHDAAPSPFGLVRCDL